MHWLPNPEPRTLVCLGFDGSDIEDWTALRAETIDGFMFTPRVGVNQRPAVWNPAEFADHRIPRIEVAAAVDELFDRYQVERMYCDPPGWQSEIEAWALEHGDEHVIEWPTYRPRPMFASLERFVTDLRVGSITHDGCPITERHIANAVKATRTNSTYVLAKASKPQKIDAAMANALAHEAACDARADGWGEAKSKFTRAKGRATVR